MNPEIITINWTSAQEDKQIPEWLEFDFSGKVGIEHFPFSNNTSLSDRLRYIALRTEMEFLCGA
jgi:hypothetical protein